MNRQGKISNIGYRVSSIKLFLLNVLYLKKVFLPLQPLLMIRHKKQEIQGIPDKVRQVKVPFRVIGSCLQDPTYIKSQQIFSNIET